MTDFAALLRVLTEAGVYFILVGGAAATAHGAAPVLPFPAGRPKDLDAIAELEALAYERNLDSED